MKTASNTSIGYYGFGTVMKGRDFTSDKYRYGFNGQEKDDEVSGGGNSYDFEFRFFNTRLGRFLSMDPLVTDYPSNSPYTFAENCVIRFVELEGKEIAEPEQFQVAMALIGYLETTFDPSTNNSTVFSGITRTEVLNQLKAKLQNMQGAITVGEANSGGWYCGTAADMVVAAAYNPIAYVSTVWDLATQGQVAVMGGNKVTATVPDWAKSESSSGGKVNGIDAIDWIVRTSVRSSENDKAQSGTHLDTRESQGTWPTEQRQQLARFGLQTKHASYYSGQNNASLRRIEKAVKGGYLPIVFENHMISHPGGGKDLVRIPDNVPIFGGKEKDLGIHYIVITQFERNKKDKTVTYKFIEYGGESGQKTVSYKDFKKGAKGYWIPKNQKGAGGTEKK